MASELAIALRVNAVLDQARNALKQLRGDIDALGTAGTGAAEGIAQVDDAATAAGIGKVGESARDAGQALGTLGAAGENAGKALNTVDGSTASSGVAKVGTTAQEAAVEVEALGKAATDASKQLDIDGTGASAGVAKVGSTAEEAASAVTALGQAGTDAGKKLNLESSGAAESTAAITQSTKEATQATDALDQAAARSSTSAQTATRSYTDEMNALYRASLQQQAKANADDQAAAASQRAAAAVGTDRDAVARLLAQIDPTERALQRFDEQQRQLNVALERGAIDAEQYAAAMKLAQSAVSEHGEEASGAMKSLGIETTRARTELITIGHEVISGNFSRIPGSMMVLAESSNLATVAVRLLLNPFTLLGAAVLATGTAYLQGSKDQHEFQMATLATGNYAGMTREHLIELGQQATAVSNITATAASKAALAMTASGRLDGATIDNLTKSVGTYADITGQSSERATESLIKLFEDPKRGAEELNQSMHFLDAGQLAYINRLVETGQTEKAQQVLSQELYTYLQDHGVASVDSLTRKWLDLKNAVGEGWELLKRKITGTTTPADDIADIEARMKARVNVDSAEQKAKDASDLADAKRRQTNEENDAAEKARLVGQKIAQAAAAAEYKRIITTYESADDKRKKSLDDLDDLYKKNLITQQEYNKGVSAIQAQANKGADRKAFQGTRVDTANQLAQLKADLSVQQAQYKDNDAIIVQAYKDGTKTLQDAYDARLDIIKKENADEVTATQAELDSVNAALSKAKTPEERGPLQQRQISLTAHLQVLQISLDQSTRQLTLWKTEAEKTLATVTAKVRVDVSNLTGTFDSKAVEDSLKLQYENDYKAAGNLPEDQQAAERARVDLIIKAGVEQAAFNAKLAEAQRLQDALSVQEGQINNLTSTGQISAIEGEARLQAARAAQVPQLATIQQQLEQIRDAMPKDAAVSIDAANVSIGNLKNTVTAATPVIVDFGTKAKNQAIDSLSDAAGSAVSNFENLGDTVKSTLKNIAGDIVSSGIKDLLKSLFSSSGSSSSTGGLFGVAVSGVKSLFGFADGGAITGPGTGTSDSIPAIVDGKKPIAVSSGEWITPKASVDYYGHGFMEAVRTRKLPRPGFAFGGLVRAAAAARYATGGAVSSSGSSDASNAPQVQINMTNNGTPQRVASQQTTVSGKDQVINIILEDYQRGGPISRMAAASNGRS